MKRYAKALVAFVLALAMVSEAWGGLSFVSEAETSTETSAQAETVDLTNVTAFPIKKDENAWKEWYKEGNTLEETCYKIDSASQFISFARASRYDTFDGKTIYLEKSFIYSGGTFGGIGLVDTSVCFQGTFDGLGKTIYDMTVGTKGIFASIKGATIKNLVLDNATMTSSNNEKRGLLVSKASSLDSRKCSIEGITIKKSSMTAHCQKSALLVGFANDTFSIKNCGIEKSTMNFTRDNVDSTACSGYGLVVGYAANKVNLNGVHVEDSSMTFDANTWVSNVGGLVGYSGYGGSITNCSIKNNESKPVISSEFTQPVVENPNQHANKAQLPDGVNPTEIKATTHVGGAIGCAVGNLTVKNVFLKNVDIKIASVFHNVGGFVGYVKRDASDPQLAATFENCKVKDADINGSLMILDPGFNADGTDKTTTDDHYYRAVAGFAACVDSDSKFTKCTVDNTNVITGTRYKYGGGLIGSTFTQAADGTPTKGIVTVERCSVTNTKVDTYSTANRNCNVGGGLIALLGEGSVVRNCYVNEFKGARNDNSLYMGGLIGDVYNIVVTDEITVIENCYVGVADIHGFNHVAEVIGWSEDINEDGYQNLWYCKDHTVVTRNSDRISKGEKYKLYIAPGVKGNEHEAFTSGEIAYYLNEAATAETPNQIWGVDENGIVCFVDDENKLKPYTIMVIFVRYSNMVSYFLPEGGGTIDTLPKNTDGFKWINPEGGNLDSSYNFTKTTWVYEREIHMPISRFEENQTNGITEVDYYIQTKEDLKTFQTLSQKYTFEGKIIHMAASIDWNEDGKGTENWEGIGSATFPFCGTFDGHGETISNLYSTKAGLFNYIGNEGIDSAATIKNLTVANANISSADMTADNKVSAAIVVSQFRGMDKNNVVKNVHVVDSKAYFDYSGNGAKAILVGGFDTVANKGRITISDCTVTDCYMFGTKEELNKNWGFIIGRDGSEGHSLVSGCTVTNSHMTAENGNFRQAGAIAGYMNNSSGIEGCTVEGCTITGKAQNVKIESEGIEFVGGIIGLFQAGGAKLTDCTVKGTSISLNGKDMKTVGLVAGRMNAGTARNLDVINSTITLTGDNASSNIGGLIGTVGNGNERTFTLSDCDLSDITITVANQVNNVGGIVGSFEGIMNEDVIMKDSGIKNITINSTYSSNSEVAMTNVGGAIGRVADTASSTKTFETRIKANNIVVDGVQISTQAHLKNVAGFVGSLTGAKGSTFENCKVLGEVINGEKTSKITQTFATAPTSELSYHVAGFAALSNTDSSYTLCVVDCMDVKLGTPSHAFGGIVGTTYDAKTKKSFSTVEINRCTSNEVTYDSTTNEKDQLIGGILGAVACDVAPNSITNCLVSNFITENQMKDNVGGIVGRLHNENTLTSEQQQKTVIRNCLLLNSTLKAPQKTSTNSGNTIHQVVGRRITDARIENNYHYGCTITPGSTNQNVIGIEIKDDNEDTTLRTSCLINTTLAYNLNTTNGTELNSGSWAQGETNPIIATEDIYPVAYVTYQGYQVYYKFPIKADGTPDYTKGTQTVISEIELEKASSEDAMTGIGLNRANKADVEYRIGVKRTYREVKKEITYIPEDLNNPEPIPNSGRTWQYPEGGLEGIRTDVTVVQVHTTAWDYNGDTELNVADLVRRKKYEAGKGGNKAATIGSVILNKPDRSETTKTVMDYADNSSLQSTDYLDAARLRRIILTPPSTELTVLSWNINRGSAGVIADAGRRIRMMECLGLTEKYAKSKTDDIIPIDDAPAGVADIIVLQDVYAGYWHDAIYKEYLVPVDYTSVEDRDGEYERYQHVGIGQYGHRFYNNFGNAYTYETYTLFLFDNAKYKYRTNGTIFFSNTPTAASYKWSASGTTEEDPVNALCEEENAANWALFTNRQTGEEVMVVAVKFTEDSATLGSKQALRMKEVELLLRRIKEVLGRTDLDRHSGGIPIIIAGDFSAKLTSDQLDAVDAYSYALQNQYSDMQTMAPDTEQGGTYNGWSEFLTDKTNFPSTDHILTSKECEPIKFEIVTEKADYYNGGVGDGTKQYHVSDHCPIKATMDVGIDYLRSTTERSDYATGTWGQPVGTYLEWKPAK